MIESIFVQNYRGIRSCKIEGLKVVNVLIGRNNSGKSSVLESIYLASAAFHSEERLSGTSRIGYLLNRRCYRGYSWSSAKEILWYKYDTSQPISVDIKLNGKDIKVRLFSKTDYPLVHYQTRFGNYVKLLEFTIRKNRKNEKEKGKRKKKKEKERE